MQTNIYNEADFCEQQPKDNGFNNSCAHCGLTCDSSIEGLDKETNNIEYFCCIGCRTVKNVIRNSGLSDYYRVRETLDQPGIRPNEISFGQGVYLNDPLFLEKYTEVIQDNNILVRFFVPEVYCGACVWLLERINLCNSGVLSSELSLVNKQLRVVYNPKLTTLSEISKNISSFGYTFQILDKNQKSNPAYKNEDLSRLAVAVFCAMNCMMIAVSLYQGWWTGIDKAMKVFLEVVSALLALPTLTYSAKPIIQKALAGVRFKKITLDFPLAFGIVSGYILSLCGTLFGLGEVYYDSITVLIALLLTARYANSYTLEKYRRQGDMLKSIFPQYALIVDQETREQREVFVDRLEPGLFCVLKNQTVIPADGELIDGIVYLDSSIISGEIEPIKVIKGGMLWAGTKVIEGSGEMKISSRQENSRFYENISALTANTELGSELMKKIDHRSSYFVLWIFCISIISFSYHYSYYDFRTAYEVLLAILVISCPCALGISIPFSYTSACIKAASRGIYFGNGGAIERLAQVKRMVFDKTGTLTKGSFSNIEGLFISKEISEDEILSKIYAVEFGQAHPLARAITKYVSSKLINIRKYEILDRSDLPGKWVGANFKDGSGVRVGSVSLIENSQINYSDSILNNWINQNSTLVYVTYNQTLVFVIKLSDAVRDEMPELIKEFNKREVETYILSGDRKEVVMSVANICGISKANSYCQLLPEQKKEKIEKLGDNVVMVGDGVNDIQALKSASLGISVTGGLELLQKAGGISILDFSSQKLYAAYFGSLSTIKSAKLSIVFSTLYNIFATVLASLGLISPLAAALLMPISSISVVLIAAKVPKFDFYEFPNR